MLKTPIAPFVILVATDFADESARAMALAKEYAGRVPSAEVHVVHCIHPSVREEVVATLLADGSMQSKAAIAKATLLLENACLDLNAGPSARLCGHLRIGDAAKEIVQLANDIQADLLAIGTHGRRGVARILLGSVAEQVVRTAPCPVVVARAKAVREGVAIEPPCLACLEVRRAAAGDAFWCARHAQHHPRAHTYSELPQPFGAGWMTLQP